MLRHDRAVRLCKSERKDLNATHPARLKGLKFPGGGGDILTDATRHETRQEGDVHAAISCPRSVK